jgi:hypothetical protein
MALHIISADPYDLQQSVVTDSKVVIRFDGPIDPFTVSNGLSLYTPSPGLWTGPDLAILDTKYADVLDVTQEYTYFQYSYTIDNYVNDGGATITNGQLTVTPLLPFLPDRDYYFAIYPGNDASRYISKQTFSEPVYTLDQASTSLNTISVNSAFSGDVAGTYSLVVTDVNGTVIGISSTLNGVTDYRSVDISSNVLLDLTKIKLSFSSLDINGDPVIWTVLDQVEIDVFPAEGIDVIAKNKFTTTHVAQGNFPSSTKINTLSSIGKDASTLRLISSIPANLTLNNVRYNPITLKFNQNIDAIQDIASRIMVKRRDMNTGVVRAVKYYYKITDSTVKLYLTSLQ